MTQPLQLDLAGVNELSDTPQNETEIPPSEVLATSLDLNKKLISSSLTKEPQSNLSNSDLQLPKTPAVSALQSDRRSQSRSRSSDSSPSRNSLFSSVQPDSYHHLIARSFAPRVAVFASPDTEELVKGKGITGGLCGLLRPFGENVSGKVIIRDSIGGSKGWDGFGIRFVNSHVLQQSSTTSVSGASGLWDSQARFNGALSPTSPRSSQDPSSSIEASLKRDMLSKRSPLVNGSKPFASDGAAEQDDARASPFYRNFLRKLLSSSPLVPFESFGHPVTCLIVVSSHNPAPIDALRKLYASTGHGSHSVPEWMGTEYLRYYVLIHDEEADDITKSTALFDLMKRHFGLHCHLLRLKSSKCILSHEDSFKLPPIEWLSAEEEMAIERMKDYTNDVEQGEQYIPESDATSIKTFIREMVVQSIIPFMENRVVTWNDQVASRRRGLSGRFMSLSKRWAGFGSTKSGTSSPGGSNPSGSNYNAQEGFYPSDSPEAMMRQLADYAFMLRDWKLAYATYDFVRADFGHDKAWQYHAAANEMAAITSLLNSQNSAVRYRADLVDQMLETAGYSYLTRCAMPWGVIRCFTLAVELLKSRGYVCADDAARWGGKLLELDILRPISQTLATERVAECYMSRTSTRKRQAAFWNILASSGWLKIDRPDLAQRRLMEATSVFESLRYENSRVPFLSMRTFWNDLNRTVTETGPDDSIALIDTSVEQQEQLEFSTFGDKSPTPTFARLAAGIEDVDSEGFTSQNAGHVTHSTVSPG